MRRNKVWLAQKCRLSLRRAIEANLDSRNSITTQCLGAVPLAIQAKRAFISGDVWIANHINQHFLLFSKSHPALINGGDGSSLLRGREAMGCVEFHSCFS